MRLLLWVAVLVAMPLALPAVPAIVGSDQLSVSLDWPHHALFISALCPDHRVPGAPTEVSMDMAVQEVGWCQWSLSARWPFWKELV